MIIFKQLKITIALSCVTSVLCSSDNSEHCYDGSCKELEKECKGEVRHISMGADVEKCTCCE